MAKSIIKLPHQLDEAIRMLTVIDSFQGVRVPYNEIEKYCSIRSQTSARNVLKKMTKAGIIDSMRSRVGGYSRKRKTNLLELMSVLMRNDEFKLRSELPEETDVRSSIMCVQGRMAKIII